MNIIYKSLKNKVISKVKIGKAALIFLKIYKDNHIDIQLRIAIALSVYFITI
jgi:hypothetical protein